MTRMNTCIAKKSTTTDLIFMKATKCFAHTVLITDSCYSGQKSCQVFEDFRHSDSKTSIVVGDSTGRVGNHLFLYALLASLMESFKSIFELCPRFVQTRDYCKGHSNCAKWKICQFREKLAIQRKNGHV